MIDSDNAKPPGLNKDANIALARILWRVSKEIPGAEVEQNWPKAKPAYMKEARKFVIAMKRNGLTIVPGDIAAVTPPDTAEHAASGSENV